MKRKSKKWLSVLMAAAMTVGSLSLSVCAAPVDEAAVLTDTTAAAAEASDAREVNFNKDWKFLFGDQEGAEQVDFDDSSWEDEQLPHDFSITQEYSNNYEAESGFLPGGTGWYRKSVVLPAEYAKKTLVLNFDGVYNHAYVYVNGEKLGENHYGYNDFAFDISGYVTCDGSTENVIAVKVVSSYPSSRWYSGSGIYRDVELIVTDAVHVEKNGTYVTTPDLEEEQSGDVTVHVDTTVKNDGSASVDAVVRTTILDADGGQVSVPESTNVTVAADTASKVEQNTYVNRPALWSCDSPNLYYVQTEILVDGVVKDTYRTTFGFRYINYDANTGFSLNGENVKLKGVCMHHDQGALGSAAYRDAVYRQVEKLKEMGCNAIRTSHSTPADVLLDACNELGVMVMDETYDGWEYAKNDNTQDFGTHFAQTLTSDNQILGGETGETWYKFVLEANINRDKNDPSVVIWDIGNELNFGVPASNNYVQYAKNMISYIQEIDDTRPITSGDNNPWGDQSANPTDFRNQITAELVKAGGVAGMNYSMSAISGVHSAHPAWPIVATETASPSNSRGIYNTLSQYGKSGDYQCTAYDTNWVSWGNSARESWYYTIKDDFVSGEFIWTGFDYIGEPTPWNGTGAGTVSGDQKAVPNSSYFGVIDTAGFEKDSFYFYTSQWREDATTLHVVPQSWNEEDLAVSGGMVPVYVYSNAATVELYLNDKLIGTSTRNPITTDAGYEWATYTSVSEDTSLCTAVNESTVWKKMAIQFSVQYEEGTLSAKAYDKDGNLIEDTLGLDSVTTNSDQGTSLKVEAEKTELQADGSSLSYIAVDVVDKEGRFVSSARNNIRFTLTGNGAIVGVDNGNPSTIDKFQQRSVLTSEKTANIDAFSGKALVIVRSTEYAGGFVLNAEASGLKSGKVFVNTVGETEGEAFLKDYSLTTEYTFVMGTKPAFQTTVTGTLSNNSAVQGTVEWSDVTEEVYNTPGEYVIEGVMKLGTEEIKVSANLHVKPIIAAMKNYSRATTVGVVPALPATAAAILPDGRSYGEYPVVWDSISASDLQETGKILVVNGAAAIGDGATMPVQATIRVAEGVTVEAANVAPQYETLVESCKQTADNLLSIVDGVNNILNQPNARWTNWNDHLVNSSPSITFTWEEVKEIASLKAWFFGDVNVTAPEEVKIEVSEDGVNYDEVSFAPTEYLTNQETAFILDEAKKAKALKFTMKQVGTGYVGLTELEIWTTTSGYTTNSTAVLDTLTVDGRAVDGFVSGEASEDAFHMEVSNVSRAAVRAAAKDNASVTVVPADASGMARVIVTSEDQRVTNVYQIQLTDRMPTGEQKKALQSAVAGAAGITEQDYTAESYAAVKTALEAARLVQANANATAEQVEKALADLQKAVNGLVKKPVADPPTETVPKKGSTFEYKKAIYKVTKSDAKNGTVTFVKPKVKTNKTFTVPATVKSGKYTFKVTAVNSNAFKNNKKLTKVTIGKNVQKIGSSAFAGDGKLKNITIRTSSLKSVGSKAFKGIHAKCRIKVPKKKLSAYRKKLSKRGQKSTVKITK